MDITNYIQTNHINLTEDEINNLLLDKEKNINILIKSYLRMVYKIAMNFVGLAPFEDMVSYGMIGLHKGILDYDPDRNPNFKGHIIARIRYAMLNGLTNTEKIKRGSVKATPVSQILENEKDDFWQIYEGDSYDVKYNENDFLITERIRDILSDRDAHMVFLYYGLDGYDQTTVENIGRMFSVSKQRVSQIIHHSTRAMKYDELLKRYLEEYL